MKPPTHYYLTPKGSGKHGYGQFTGDKAEIDKHARSLGLVPVPYREYLFFRVRAFVAYVLPFLLAGSGVYWLVVLWLLQTSAESAAVNYWPAWITYLVSFTAGVYFGKNEDTALFEIYAE